MIDLYSAATPNGQKIHIMLEETGLEYRVKWVSIDKGDQFEPEFLKISPNNKFPAIVDHDGPGDEPMPLFESGAILLYLADKSGTLPTSPAAFCRQSHASAGTRCSGCFGSAAVSDRCWVRRTTSTPTHP